MTAKKQSLLDKGVIINVRLSGLLCPAFPFVPGLVASASVGAAMVLPGTEPGGGEGTASTTLLLPGVALTAHTSACRGVSADSWGGVGEEDGGGGGG